MVGLQHAESISLALDVSFLVRFQIMNADRVSFNISDLVVCEQSYSVCIDREGGAFRGIREWRT